MLQQLHNESYIKHVCMLKRMLSCEPANGGMPKSLEIILTQILTLP